MERDALVARMHHMFHENRVKAADYVIPDTTFMPRPDDTFQPSHVICIVFDSTASSVLMVRDGRTQKWRFPGADIAPDTGQLYTRKFAWIFDAQQPYPTLISCPPETSQSKTDSCDRIEVSLEWREEKTTIFAGRILSTNSLYTGRAKDGSTITDIDWVRLGADINIDPDVDMPHSNMRFAPKTIDALRFVSHRRPFNSYFQNM